MPLRGLRLLWDVALAALTLLMLVAVGWLMGMGIDWAISAVLVLLGGLSESAYLLPVFPESPAWEGCIRARSRQRTVRVCGHRGLRGVWALSVPVRAGFGSRRMSEAMNVRRKHRRSERRVGRVDAQVVADAIWPVAAGLPGALCRLLSLEG